MPVLFSEKKRLEISRQIKEAALRLFETKGIRKTTVAELSENVGIAKGTFYNFYATNGQLAAEIIDDFDAASEQELRTKFGARDKIPITEFFNYYVELFRPNTAFSFHFKPDDIALMQEADFRQEIRRLILSSNHVLVPIGFVLGIPFGLALANMITLANAASGGILMFTTLTGKTLLISAVFIAAAYVVSLVLSARKLKKVDMVECLKEERE